MLEFFRKYQRYFFIVIAVVVVVSFSFFGTQQALNTPQKVEDRPIGLAVDGSKFMRMEMDEIVRFIWSDRSDLTLIEKNIMPNFFNDGVVRNDLLDSGIGALVINEYFDELKEELTERMERHKKFRPYAHPTASFISVENLWAQVLPSQKVNLDVFLNETKEMSPEVFNLLVDVYLGETAFPPHILREYLLFQQKHYNWIQPDPAIQKTNLNIFQCRTIEDWFGPRFLELCAQFISNGALIARQKGYQVSYEAARVDLFRNGYESLKIQKRNENVSEEELRGLWKEQLLCLHMDEKAAVQVWQKVMLFRRLFKDIGRAVFVDPHIYQTFHGFASKTAGVDLYHLPPELEMKDFKTMMKLELYLDLVSGSARDPLMLPKKFISTQEMEKKCPELVQKRLLVEVSEVQKDLVALHASMQEMWEWQLQKENYQLLESQFPGLALKKAQNAEEYFAALEGLDPKVRQKLDRFSRSQIVDLHPEWTQAALNEAPVNKREICISSCGKDLPFEGITEAEPLLTLFTETSLKGELESNPQAIEASKKLEAFSSDGRTYYRFQVIDRDLDKDVLTFAEANEKEVLDALLSKQLEEAYIKLRTPLAALFKNADNEWKDCKDVELEVGRLVYADVLKAIEADAQEVHLALPVDRYENLNDFYPQHRLYAYMRHAYRDIKRVGEGSAFLLQKVAAHDEDTLDIKAPLDAQWGLLQEEKVFKNHHKNSWFHSDIFSMVEQSWSDVALRGSGVLSFFQLREKSVPNGNFNPEMKEGKAILSREAERLLTREILDLLKEKQAIHLTGNHERS